jgi:hypothetical protein
MLFVSFTLNLFGTTFRVPDDFSTISLAIEAAENLTGSVTIEVEGDTYNENIDIDLTLTGLSHLTLIGVDGADECIIDGSEIGDVINISGDYDTSVNISGFTIIGSGDESADRGIDVYHVDLFLSESIIDFCKYAFYAVGSNIIECSDNEFYCQETTSVSSLFRLHRIDDFLFQDNYIESFYIGTSQAIIITGSEGDFLDNSFINTSGSISLWYYPNDENNNVKIEGNLFHRDEFCIGISRFILVDGCDNLLITNNIFENENIGNITQAIKLHVARNNRNNVHIIENFFNSCAYYYYSQGSNYPSQYCFVDLINNTFCNSTVSAIYLEDSNSLQYCKNNIFYNNENDVITNSLNTLGITPTISYNSLEEDILALYPNWLGEIESNQINVEPRFNIGEYTLFYESELNKSPCIDAADPDTNGNDVDWQYDEDDRDIDGSRKDMGCYPYLHDYDTKVFTKGVHWVSFPVLTSDGTYEPDPPNNIPSIPPIDYQLYQQAYEENDDPGLLQDETGAGTIDEFIEILGNRYGTPMKIKPVLSNYEDNDEDFKNMLFRHEGYKIEIDSTTDPTELKVGNGVGDERLPVNYEISGSMVTDEYHWIGYWIPRTQSMIESFGDFWQKVKKVKSEDWFYSPFNNNQRGDDPTYPIALDAENLTLEYGKAYLVLFNEQIENFSWTDTGITVEAEKESEPESFTYTEKADYEAIDVFNIPPNVIEIGVFEDDICVGAVVVEDTCAQILVYSDNANRNPIPFTFEVVTGRGLSFPIKNYQVMNMETGEYETKSIFSSRQEYSVMRFSDEEELEDNILSTPQLHGNYPNPFNPTTTISFSLPEEQEIDLTIYNIKGQKVKRLIDGQLTSGQHSMTWDGKDTNGKSVSTGIYFYRLKTGKKEISRKMLLLK